jgi:hypothetical protein
MNPILEGFRVHSGQYYAHISLLPGHQSSLFFLLTPPNGEVAIRQVGKNDPLKTNKSLFLLPSPKGEVAIRQVGKSDPLEDKTIEQVRKSDP